MNSLALNSFSRFGLGLAGALVVGGLAPIVLPSMRGYLGLVAARAAARPWTLVTSAFTGHPINVREGQRDASLILRSG